MLNFSNQLIENVFSIKGLHFWRLRGGLLIVKMSLVFNQNILAAFFLLRWCHSIPAGGGGVAGASQSPRMPEVMDVGGFGC